MSLGKKIPIEPLSQARASRIERAVFDRLDAQIPEIDASRERSSRLRLWLLRSTAAVAASLLALMGLRIAHVWSPSVPAEANVSRIVTGASDSRVALTSAAIDVAPESEVVMTGDDEQGILIVLNRGSITCDVAPRRSRPPFVVQAAGVRVRVVGTLFRVTRDGESARVAVVHGTVEIGARGQVILVRDGETWPAGPTRGGAEPPGDPAALGVRAAHDGSEAPDMETASLRPARGQAMSAVRGAAAKRHATPANVETSNGAAPASVTPIASAQASRAPSAGHASQPAAASESADPVPASPSDDAIASDQRLFEQAAGLEGQDPLRAIAIYRDLAGRGGPWSMNALFAEASLEAARGNGAEARRLLDAYVARYPRGPNARDARALLDRLQ
jgi:hypothetical protein